MAAIFFSHSSRDDKLARQVELWLAKKGFEDIFVDHSSIRSGDKWTEALRRAGGSCRVVVCLVTPAWLSSSECFGEFLAGWYAGRRMIALICAAIETLDTTQKERLSRVLLEDQGVDLSQAGDPSALDLDAHPEISAPLIEGLRAAGALAKVGLDPSVFPIDDRRDSDGNLIKPPFPGLESFGDTDADAATFYGRSAEIAQVLEELREFRATGDLQPSSRGGRAYVIQGASGSGKSSLLKAGVLPRLRREQGWVILRSFRPGAEPLLAFAEALAKPFEGAEYLVQSPGAIRDQLLSEWRLAKSEARKACESTAKGPGEAHIDFIDQIELKMLCRLRTQLDALIIPLKKKLDRPAATALIAIDQGEELVRSEGDGADALADYIKAALLPANEGEPAQYAAALTVRSDTCQELQTSHRMQGLGMRLFDLRALPIYRFAEAIEQPAARYGVEIEPQLVELLMEDAGGRDALPLLAFTLQRLWRQYEAQKRIRKANYESMGKLLGLIEDAAERALRGFDPAAKQGPLTGNVSKSRDAVAHRAFVPGLAQINERGGTIRRVANWSNFGEDDRDILNWFEKWRLVVSDGPYVEVAHEALFRAWPRFVHWLESERARLVALRGIESAAATWNSNGRSFDFIVHTGYRLRLIKELLKSPDFKKYVEHNEVVRSYLQAARRASFGRRLAFWYSAYGMITVALVLGVLLWAYATGDAGLLVPLIGGVFGRLMVAILLVGTAYSAAAMRELTLRSGIQSDLVISLAAAIMTPTIAGIYYYKIFYSAGGYLAIMNVLIATYTQIVASPHVAQVMITMAAFSDFCNLLALPCVCWMVLQSLALATIPLKYLMRRRAQCDERILAPMEPAIATQD
jgi:hypothetical protein